MAPLGTGDGCVRAGIESSIPDRNFVASLRGRRVPCGSCSQARRRQLQGSGGAVSRERVSTGLATAAPLVAGTTLALFDL